VAGCLDGHIPQATTRKRKLAAGIGPPARSCRPGMSALIVPEAPARRALRHLLGYAVKT
jgi:hypothetical protein